jgi:Domain of unknown function (DUF4389)
MRPARVVLLVLGSLLALIGFGLLAGGGSLGWALATQRDDAGYFTTSTERFATESYAITSDKIDLGNPGPDDWWAEQDLATVRIIADNAGSGELFVGIGPEADVEAYLAGVAHDEVTDVEFNPFTVDYRREHPDGTTIPAVPTDQAFWVAQATGAATQSLTWDLEPGRWAIVVMNADAQQVVAADIELGGQVDYLVQIAIGLAIGGVVLLAIATAMIVGSVVRPVAAGPAAGTAAPVGAPLATPVVGPAVAPRSSPVRIEGHLDPALGRWQWLVKWFLAIPHFVVLAFLWVAFVVLTIVAWFAILFTGRYPRSIFDFNVGVLRWTWRVSYYATSALGTDRYPPFTLSAVDYPATLEIAYPERLSRGLVLVKSWLLAIPHLIIVGVLTATWSFGAGDDDGTRFLFGGGLLGILVAVAVIILLFTGRYPRGLYDLIMGVNRWEYRVIAYVALMTDEYPPFHLDQGGSEPALVESGARTTEPHATTELPPPLPPSAYPGSGNH